MADVPTELMRLESTKGIPRRASLIVRTVSNLGSLAESGTGQNNSFRKLPEGTDVENQKGEPEDPIALSKKNISFFHNRTWQKVTELYKTNTTDGLSEAEAEERLKIFGKNQLASEPRDPWWKIFLGQLTDLLVVMLLIAAIVSGAFEEYAQCTFIIVLVVGMASLGTFQEVRAGDSLDALSSLSAPNADVVRGGKTMTLDSTLLVPGDIILLEMGRTIPADCRMVTCQGLQSAEAALTGESVGKKKNPEFVGVEGVVFHDDKGEKQENQNICFMGCTVLEGRGRGVVVKTGMNTEMGLIASLINNADETRSPLQIQLERLGKQLGVYSFSLSLVVWIIGVSTGRGLDPHDSQDKFLQMTLVAVALTVAAVPEALPTMVTITLAMGMNRMSKRKAILRNLHGTVTLASVSVICSDKTGTLTAGEMTATRVWVDHKINRITGVGFKPEGFVVPEGVNLDDAGAVKAAHDANRKGMHLIAAVVATLCSDVTIQDGEIKGNMSEKPLVVATLKTGMTQGAITKACPRIHEIPFDSKRKMMSTLVTNDNDYKGNGEGLEEFALGSFPELRRAAAFSCVKGAPNFVLEFCTRIMRQNGTTEPLSADEKKAIMNKIDDLSSEALRVLAVAVRLFDRTPEDLTPENVERELVLIGMFASIDPERVEVKPAIQTAYNAGIRVVAISGDYTKTLFAIAKNIGLLKPDAPFSKVLDCEEIRPDGERAIAIENKLADHKKKSFLTPEEQKAFQEELATINTRLDKVTNFVDCFGRAKPQDKIVILKSLQRQGHIASMTGDGVNDAPALKQANIGVAMGSGTDAAKAASSMILVDDSFSTIVAGVEEGRAIFRNISIFIFMLLSENVAEVLFVLLSGCFDQPYPLKAIQLLLLNLFTDGAPAIALAVETSGNDSLMSEGPRNIHESIISPIMRVGIAIHTVILCGMCILMYTLALIRYTGSPTGKSETHQGTKHELEAATTVAYLYIVSAELLRAYTCRSLRDSVFTIGVFSNPWMQKSVVVGFIGAVSFAVIPELNEALDFVQLKGEDWAYIFGLCWIPCISEELIKYIYRQTGYGIRPIAVRGDKRED